MSELPSGSTILEIGCGGGQMRAWISNRGHRYIGTDISSKRVNEKLQQEGGPDVLCDAHFLPFQDEKIDLVYSAAVTEHLASPQLVAQEVSRVLKPGGYYLGNVSFMEPWHDNSYFHMSPLGVFENLTQGGLDAKYIWPGVGYSGYQAVMFLGNKATQRLTFLGRLIDLLYRNANRARNFARGLPNWSSDRIEDCAKVAGATDWIAQKPPVSRVTGLQS